MKVVFTVILLIISLAGYTQPGFYPVSDVIPEEGRTPEHIHTLTHTGDNLLLAGNPEGIYLYTGYEWKLLQTPAWPLKIKYSPEIGGVVVAGAGYGGILKKNANGVYNYYPLKKYNNKKPEFRDILFNASSAFLISDSVTVQAEYSTLETKEIKSSEMAEFSPCHELQEVSSVLFHESKSKKTLLCRKEYDFALYTKGTVIPLNVPESLSDEIINDAVWINDTTIAIATSASGCFIQTLSGKLLSRIDHYTGLKEPEVKSLAYIRGKLWMGHNKGVSYIDTESHFRDLTYYPGLSGYNTCAIKHKDKLYVGTNEGVYCLDSVQNQQDTKVIVKYMKPVKKSFFKSLFSKRKKQNYKVVKEEVKSRNKEDKRHSHFFRKLNASPLVCETLYEHRGRLYAGTRSGLYVKKGNEVVSAGINAPVYCLTSANNMLIAGTDNGFYIIRGGKTKHIDTGCPIYSVAFHGNKVWMSSTGKVLTWADGTMEELHYPVSVYKPFTISASGDRVYFISRQKVYTWSKETGKIVPASDFFCLNSEYYQGQDSGFFYRCDNSFYYTNRKGGKHLIHRLSDIDKVTKLLSFKNEILVFSGQRLLTLDQQYARQAPEASPEILALHIRDRKGQFLPLAGLEFDHNNTEATFQFSSSCIHEKKDPSFQFKVEGISKEWSRWQKNSSYHLPYLPPGNYTLKSRTRNHFGQVSPTLKIPISVKPPYWKTMWFNFTKIAFFATLIILSVFFNRMKQNMVFTKIFSFLTLIICLESVHQYVESTYLKDAFESPVLKFSTQVLLALMILPLEKILQYFFGQSKKPLKEEFVSQYNYFLARNDDKDKDSETDKN